MVHVPSDPSGGEEMTTEMFMFLNFVVFTALCVFLVAAGIRSFTQYLETNDPIDRYLSAFYIVGAICAYAAAT